ncbi:MAG TPA: FkbM family methyltransferase [Phycisphaerae bacterium]|nr:FkbM family methyltransferase [Phycisphaerae bacterium]
MSPFRRVFRAASRYARFYWRLPKAKRLRIRYFPPNYIFRDSLTPSSVVVDVGCGHEAELSVHLISTYGLRAFGVDPTRKHAPALRTIEQRYAERFRYLARAVAAKGGTLTFHESDVNESGSLLGDHTNVVHDTIRSYQVEAVTLRGLLEEIGCEHVDFLKLDLEGAEYELLDTVAADALQPFTQVFVEFHHHCIERFSVQDTRRAAEDMRQKGFQSFTLDDHNYLFYR